MPTKYQWLPMDGLPRSNEVSSSMLLFSKRCIVSPNKTPFKQKCTFSSQCYITFLKDVQEKIIRTFARFKWSIKDQYTLCIDYPLLRGQGSGLSSLVPCLGDTLGVVREKIFSYSRKLKNVIVTPSCSTMQFALGKDQTIWDIVLQVVLLEGAV